MRRVVVGVALGACGTSDAPPRREPAAASATSQPGAGGNAPTVVEKMQMTVPDGWTRTYDAEDDKWLLETPPLADGRTMTARIEHAPRTAIASPDAFLHHRLRVWDVGAKAEIEKREGVKDGFAMTIVLRSAKNPEQSKRQTFVVRQLGSVWYQCLSEAIPDDASRDQLVALCKLLTL